MAHPASLRADSAAGRAERPPLPDSVLASRLLPPRLPRSCLPRRVACDTLLDGLDGGLCAVVAGAGWGKSTLLALGVERARMPAAWVSCDRRLRHATVFLAHVGAAVSRHVPKMGMPPTRGSVERQTARLANGIAAAVSEDLALVVDDAHLLWGHPAQEALQTLIADAPPQIHIVIASRTSFPFPTARMRAGGMAVLDERDLALDLHEAEHLLDGLGVPTTPFGVRMLHRRTEGWPAGLVLAAHGAVRDPRGATAGEDDAFAYLAEEVLARLPAEIDAFLLGTALLDRFTPGIAAAAADAPDAAEMLARLEADHLFVVRLDGEGDWFRHHHLLQAFLRRRLAAEGPDRVNARHRRAAAAWIEAGVPAEAVPHLLAAGDPAAAAAALEPEAERMVRTAEAETLTGWLADIPAEVRHGHPYLEVAEALLQHARGEHGAAIDTLDRAIAHHLDRGDTDAAASAFLRLLQVALASDRPHVGLEAGDRWLDRLAPGACALPAIQIAIATCGTWSFLRQAPAVRQLLLDTALLEHFTPRLAVAVTGRPDAEEVLVRLEGEGLFVVRVHGEGPWLRYHRLLRSFLCRRLASEGPWRLAARHRRAAAACRAEGLDAEAAHHLRAARDTRASEPPRPSARAGVAHSRASSVPGPPPRLCITSLGVFAVARDGAGVPGLCTGRQKARTLLAILLCAPGAVHREELMEWLWPHLPPPRARAALHSALYALRRMLSPGAGRGAGCDIVTADGEAYRLELADEDEWDGGRLIALSAAARGMRGDTRLARLLAAERLLSGPFLPEWPYDPWSEPRRAQIEREERAVLEGLAEELVSCGRPLEAASRYERLIAREPEGERWHRALMEVYGRTGERARALRQYATCRRVLRESLGVEPSDATVRLHRELLG